MRWTPEHDALLRNLLTEGLSCSEAAAIINSQYGVRLSRQACIGRSHRIGLAKTLPKKVRSVSIEKIKARHKLQSQRRKERRWAANPSLAYRTQRAEQRKANQQIMLDGGATKTSPAYRKHLTRQPEMTKAELRAMLRTAVQNTANMGDMI